MSAPAQDRDAYRLFQAVRSLPEYGICEGDRLHEGADGSLVVYRRIGSAPALLSDSRLSVLHDSFQVAPRLTVSRGGAA